MEDEKSFAATNYDLRIQKYDQERRAFIRGKVNDTYINDSNIVSSH